MTLTTRIPGLLLVLLTLTISTFAADSILPTAASNSFPQCGLSCTTLTGAQTSCESGEASTWVSCFCESSLLTTLKTSGSICASCSAADQTTLSTWYNNYCSSGGKDTSNSNGKDTANVATATKQAAASTPSTSDTSSSATTNKSPAAAEEKKSWYVMTRFPHIFYPQTQLLTKPQSGGAPTTAGSLW